MACSPHGNSLVQWVIALFVGSIGILVNLAIKFLPDPKKGVGNKETNIAENRKTSILG